MRCSSQTINNNQSDLSTFYETVSAVRISNTYIPLYTLHSWSTSSHTLLIQTRTQLLQAEDPSILSIPEEYLKQLQMASTIPSDSPSANPYPFHVSTPESLISSTHSPSAEDHTPYTRLPSKSKKQRTRRNARTEEEKRLRAEERAERNRLAAQESRNKKRKQFEDLEWDNKRLRLENRLLEEKLETIEYRLESVKDLEVEWMKQWDKAEEGGGFETHYPAVVMSCDRQCQTNSSSLQLPEKPFLRSPTMSRINFWLIKVLAISSIKWNPIKTTSIGYSTTDHRLPLLRNYYRTSMRKITFLTQMRYLETLLSDARATFDGLNICSLDKGAEIKMQVSLKTMLRLDSRGFREVHYILFEFELDLVRQLGTRNGPVLEINNQIKTCHLIKLSIFDL